MKMKRLNSPKWPCYSKVTFWVNLWNSFDFDETAFTRVFEVAELECILKVYVTPFLVALGLIFARKLCIARERWVVPA